ncbi:MAG: TonB-dependent receptor, partial [Chitinophagaceae bacterium]|nr:TonB-dependent receptor [Chitinophagaceae bacterium]
MRRICIVFASVWMAFTANAQSVLKLQLRDAAGMPLEGATVTVKQQKSTLAGTAGADGRANLRVATGSFRLQVSHTGMEAFDSLLAAVPAGILSITLQPARSALQPVEVRGIRAGSTAPFAKTDLTKTFIEKNNLGQDIPFLLNQTPGVVVNSDAGNGIGYTGIRIRGTDASRINMTINGIPYNDAESQGIFFVNLPDLLSSVSSIQVQRGVGTSSNGAGAFGATMNFSTHSYNPEAYAEINNSAGSFNTFKNTVKVGSGLIGKHFTIDARLSNISSDGFIDRAFSRMQSGQFTLGYYGKKSSLRFNAILGREKTYQAWYGVSQADLKSSRTVNYAGMEKPGEPYDNETDNYWQNHYQLFFNHEFNAKTLFNTAFYLTTGRGYYEQYKAAEDLADYGIAPINTPGGVVTESDLIRQLWLKNKLFGQIFSLQMQRGKSEWTVGGGWSYYPGQHFGDVIWTAAQPDLTRRWYDYDARKADANAYVKWQYALNPAWKLFADLQYRFVHYEIDGFRNNPGVQVNEQWNFVNPKAGLSYSKGNWTGFLSYAMGNKEPNRDDFEAGINQQPTREQLHDFEFNVTNKQLAQNLQVGLTLYYMYYRDQLVLTGKVNDVGAYTRVNIGRRAYCGTTWPLAATSCSTSPNTSMITIMADSRQCTMEPLILRCRPHWCSFSRLPTCP